MQIKENLITIKSQLPENVTLVAVSKTKPVAIIKEAYNAGQRVFGENKIQDMVDKQAQLPEDIEWHMIGHVQRNKVKYMAPFVKMIHSVDSLKLLKEIDKQAKNNQRIIDCLLQIKIASEDSKFGMTTKEATTLLMSEDISDFKNVNIVGVMGMATFTSDTHQIKSEFENLKNSFDTMKPIAPHRNFEIISMGMSADYQLAVACGSTMVRIGSSIFGARNYS